MINGFVRPKLTTNTKIGMAIKSEGLAEPLLNIDPWPYYAIKTCPNWLPTGCKQNSPSTPTSWLLLSKTGPPFSQSLSIKFGMKWWGC